MKKLTEAGIFKRQLYQRKPKRYEYLLTGKGRGLAPIVVALRSWGRRWTRGDDTSALLHTACNHDIGVGFYCLHCERAVQPDDIQPQRLSA